MSTNIIRITLPRVVPPDIVATLKAGMRDVEPPAAKASVSIADRFKSIGETFAKLAKTFVEYGLVFFGISLTFQALRKLWRKFDAAAQNNEGWRRMKESAGRLFDSFVLGGLRSHALQLVLGALSDALNAMADVGSHFDYVCGWLSAVMAPTFREIKSGLAVIGIVVSTAKLLLDKSVLAILDLVLSVAHWVWSKFSVGPGGVGIKKDADLTAGAITTIDDPASRTVIAIGGFATFDRPESPLSQRTAEVVELPVGEKSGLEEYRDALQASVSARESDMGIALSAETISPPALEKKRAADEAAVQGWHSLQEQLLALTNSPKANEIAASLNASLVAGESRLSALSENVLQAFRSYRESFEKEHFDTLTPILDGLDAFTQAFAFTAAIAESAAASHAAAATLIAKASMLMTAFISISLATKELIAGVAAFPNAPLMAFHFATAGLYIATAAIAAYSAGSSAPSVRPPPARPRIGPRLGRVQDMKTANVTVVVGSSVYAPDGDWIARNLLVPGLSGGELPPDDGSAGFGGIGFTIPRRNTSTTTRKEIVQQLAAFLGRSPLQVSRFFGVEPPSVTGNRERDDWLSLSWDNALAAAGTVGRFFGFHL